MHAKQDAQARLDKYHQLFAQGARTGVAAAGGNLAAELSSLRHEAIFSKARRARAMAQRATTNAPAMQLMDQILKSLPKPIPTELAALASEELCCPLSGDTAEEVMCGSDRDFFVFALRVRRPEDAIDAPTTLEVLQLLSGTYSNEAFRAGTAHAINMVGPERAHGGFVGTSKSSGGLGAEVGLFRGPDGQTMNACLPLYLSEVHFARVRVQIKPILGYFFTLDTLGYKGDQTIAMFGILGTMLCLRASTGARAPATPQGSSDGNAGSTDWTFIGKWADWLIEDFTKLCRGIQPIAMEYLTSGGYTGAVRGDLLEDFLSSPAGRTKERLPSLAVLVGWAAVAGPALCPRFHIAFVEELWRRNLTALYKGQPHEPIMEALERLLYGPASDGEEMAAANEGNVVAQNKASKDKEFAFWARYCWGDLSMKEANAVRKKFLKKKESGSQVDGPEVEGLISANTEYKPRKLLKYEDAAGFFDATVMTELQKIHRANSFVAALYENRPLGKGFSPREKWLMMIQSQQFIGNDTMNKAIAKGYYLNTFDCLAEGEEGAERLCSLLHDRFEQQRSEKWQACVERRNALHTAKRIIATEDLNAFAGRCFVSCPTRGGLVFECVVALLIATSTGNATIPRLREKVAAMLTGKVHEKPVISEGTSWVHCPLETARRLQDVVGEDEFSKIQVSMHGTWGHVYRASDLPNRHDHCNSNPNPDLTQRFSGFKFT